MRGLTSIDEAKREEARKKAKGLRYKRPIAKDLNFQKINEELWEIEEACSDCRWAIEDDDMLQAAFEGDDEQAFEFKMAFIDLLADAGKMRNAINAVEVYDEYEDAYEEPWGAEPGDNVPPIFDVFFPAVEADGGFLGFDEFEGDWYGLEYFEGEWATKEARKKVKRLTKDQILDAAGQCLRIARQYLAISYRYDCLRASFDIIREQDQTLLQLIKAIEEAYEKAEEETFHFDEQFKWRTTELDKILSDLPDRFWVE